MGRAAHWPSVAFMGGMFTAQCGAVLAFDKVFNNNRNRKLGDMPKESIGLGSAPADEEPVPIGHPDYQRLARQECLAFIRAIKRVCGEPPANARFRISSNQHDMGIYHEVEIDFDPDDEHAAHYAMKCDAGAPTTWAQADMEPPIDRGRGR